MDQEKRLHIPMTPAAEFVAAYNDIENFLRGKLNRTKKEKFYVLVDDYASRYPLPRHYQLSLSAFADLRNAISHQRYRQGRPIADPRPDTIADIQQIRDFLLAPPLAIEALDETQELRVLSPGASIAEALAYVNEFNYSQFPIYDGSTYVGMLTTNTIARWLAKEFNAYDDEATTTTVSEVYECRERKTDIGVYAPQDTTTPQAIELLTDTSTPAIALIFTDGADINATPVAIAVRDDLHMFHASLQLG